MPKRLPTPEDDEGEIVRSVLTSKDYISVKGKLWKVPQTFRGVRLAIRPMNCSGRFGVIFAAHQIATIDLTKPKSVGHLSEQVSAMSPG